MSAMHVRYIARIAITATVALTSACGNYFNAARTPIQVQATRVIAPESRSAPNAEGWTIEAKSSESSHVSGRNNLSLQATINSLSANRVEVLVLLASTTEMNTDPNNFYVHLDGGDGWVDVESIELGQTVNKPYNYQVSVPVTVESGMLRFDDGSTVKMYETKMVSQGRQENYYMRSARLIFASGDGFKPNAEKFVLRLRDLGINMSITWNLQGDA